jgi:hypothetical protein
LFQKGDKLFNFSEQSKKVPQGGDLLKAAKKFIPEISSLEFKQVPAQNVQEIEDKLLDMEKMQVFYYFCCDFSIKTKLEYSI